METNEMTGILINRRNLNRDMYRQTTQGEGGHL